MPKALLFFLHYYYLCFFPSHHTNSFFFFLRRIITSSLISPLHFSRIQFRFLLTPAGSNVFFPLLFWLACELRWWSSWHVAASPQSQLRFCDQQICFWRKKSRFMQIGLG